MNNEEKMYDLLEKIYIELQDTKKELKAEINSVRTELGSEINSVRTELGAEISSVKAELSEFRGESNERFDNLEDKIDNIEAHNAERHISINSDLRKIKSNIAKVELVTADNWSDITRLKMERRNKVR